MYSGDSSDERSERLFLNIVAILSTLALQQLGKLVNPITGKPERDLDRARDTIDSLEVLRSKTAGKLSDSEQRHLDAIIWSLQMNYIEEDSRKDKPPQSDAQDSAASNASGREGIEDE